MNTWYARQDILNIEDINDSLLVKFTLGTMLQNEQFQKLHSWK